MTYVVTEACIRCKYMDCVEVCPVDCFYEGENMLVIHPDECIDCGVCEPECPVEAIIPDSETAAERWLELNREYAATWPNITRKKPYPEDADECKDVEGKYDKYFSPNPGGQLTARRRLAQTAPRPRPAGAGMADRAGSAQHSRDIYLTALLDAFPSVPRSFAVWTVACGRRL